MTLVLVQALCHVIFRGEVTQSSDTDAACKSFSGRKFLIFQELFE